MDAFFQSYLLAYTFWLSIALGCLGLLLLHHQVGGRWGIPIRRLLEAGVGTLPLLLALVVPLLFGLRTLYPWARPDALSDAALRHKHAYLNAPFFIVRIAIYFALWMGLGFLLRRGSLQLDAAPDLRPASRLHALSAPGLVIYVLSASFAMWDLTATLDPHWYSTIYGLLMIDAQALIALAFTVLMAVYVGYKPPLSEQLRSEHLHDLGNLLLAFLMLWAYLSFMQLLITWSGNLPDESRFYIPRLRGVYGRIGIGLLVFHFAVPFLGLLSRPIKRSRGALAALALLLLLGGVFDLFWLIAPGFKRSDGSTLRALDAPLFLGIGALFVVCYLIRLRGRAIYSIGAARHHERSL